MEDLIENFERFLQESKKVLVRQNHYQQSFDTHNVYSWTYSLWTEEEVDSCEGQLGQNYYFGSLNKAEIALGVQNDLMILDSVTVCECSDGDMWIR
jgi:hypothetical protein